MIKTRKRRNPLDRFNEKWVPEPYSGCWLWTAANTWGGRYGLFREPWTRHWPAHRWSYQYFIGEVPAGMDVCHKCDTPSCVNPNHLFVGTRSDNMQDMMRKGRGNFANTSRGLNHGMSRVTEEQVRSIRTRIDKSLRELAVEYNLGKTTVAHIRAGNTWRHVE